MRCSMSPDMSPDMSRDMRMRNGAHCLLQLHPASVVDCSLCYTEKEEYAQQHLGTKTTTTPAKDNRKKQCKPNETTLPHVYPRKKQKSSYT